ncbi:MAG: hypothetical protein ACLQGT_05995 [Terracidiphilus sp.]
MNSKEVDAPMTAAGRGASRSPSLRQIQWAQALVLVALFSAPAIVCLQLAPVGEADVWWHMRTGEWIVQHGTLPHTDPFSSFGAGKPWLAYSWLFDLMIFQLYKGLGLAGLVVYCAAMVSLITVALHRMMRRIQADFSYAALLSGAAIFCMYRLFIPRPWLFSILLIVLELDLLLEARKTGRIRTLLWLPPIFALWANLHIQFIDGLLIQAILLAESVLAWKWNRVQTRLRMGFLCGIFICCALAALANPYGWRIYQVAFELASQQGVMNQVAELSAMPFRSFGDWWVLLYALAAVILLARASRFQFFEAVFLALAIAVSFHSQRDIWMLILAASVIIAAEVQGGGREPVPVDGSCGATDSDGDRVDGAGGLSADAHGQ